MKSDGELELPQHDRIRLVALDNLNIPVPAVETVFVSISSGSRRIRPVEILNLEPTT